MFWERLIAVCISVLVHFICAFKGCDWENQVGWFLCVWASGHELWPTAASCERSHFRFVYLTVPVHCGSPCPLKRALKYRTFFFFFSLHSSGGISKLARDLGHSFNKVTQWEILDHGLYNLNKMFAKNYSTSICICICISLALGTII